MYMYIYIYICIYIYIYGFWEPPRLIRPRLYASDQEAAEHLSAAASAD